MLKEFLSQRPVQVALALVVIIGISGVLYLNHVKTQTQRQSAETANRISQVATTQTSFKDTKQSAETSQVNDTPADGHFHADGTWHAGAHVSSGDELEPSNELGRNAQRRLMDAADFSLKTSEEVQEFLRTAPREAIYERARDNYIAKHLRKYPDCQEPEALLADAEDLAAYYLEYLEHRKKDQELYNEWKQAVWELDDLEHELDLDLSDPQYRLKFARRIKGMNVEEREVIALRIEAGLKKMEDSYERHVEFNQGQPVTPKPSHTH